MRHTSRSAPAVMMLTIAYAGFISLGMDASLMGVAWPSVRQEFGLPLDAVGWLFLSATTGFLLASFSAGRLAARLKLGHLLLTANLLRVAGLAGFALLPVWWGIVLCGLFTGAGSALIDSGQNFYISTNHKASHMNWMHANFGVGATIGPLMMTALISAGHSWRWGYAIVGLLQGVLTLAMLLTLPNWRARFGDDTEPDAGALQTLRLPVVWIGIALFFMYTGVEAAAGQWAFTLFTEGRGVRETVAGQWVSIYWGMLTLGRILIGFVSDHVPIKALLRSVMISVIVGAGLLWWHPANSVSFGGLALMGLGLSVIFPMLITVTPRRVGNRHAANTIGFQVGAAGVGGAALSALGGVLADSFNLEIIAPFLLISAAVMFGLHELSVITSR